MNPEQEQPSVRRIVLPSGRSIEVVRFNDSKHVTRGLNVCPECSSDLVQPIEWSEAPDDAWNLVLSCPNCDWYTEGLYTQDQVRELEDRCPAKPASRPRRHPEDAAKRPSLSEPFHDHVRGQFEGGALAAG